MTVNRHEPGERGGRDRLSGWGRDPARLGRQPATVHLEELQVRMAQHPGNILRVLASRQQDRGGRVPEGMRRQARDLRPDGAAGEDAAHVALVLVLPRGRREAEFRNGLTTLQGGRFLGDLGMAQDRGDIREDGRDGRQVLMAAQFDVPRLAALRGADPAPATLPGDANLGRADVRPLEAKRFADSATRTGEEGE